MALSDLPLYVRKNGRKYTLYEKRKVDYFSNSVGGIIMQLEGYPMEASVHHDYGWDGGPCGWEITWSRDATPEEAIKFRNIERKAIADRKQKLVDERNKRVEHAKKVLQEEGLL